MKINESRWYCAPAGACGHRGPSTVTRTFLNLALLVLPALAAAQSSPISRPAL